MSAGLPHYANYWQPRPLHPRPFGHATAAAQAA